jgi:hypothetical protein
MCSTHQKSHFIRYRDGVTNLMEAGKPFGEIEDVIEVADMTSDQKAALWLLAFSMRERGEQQREARAHLAAVAAQ